VYLKGIWISREFADVTLVSGDGTKFQAHKTVLSSSSTFFRDILLDNNDNQRVLLYLKSVSTKELELLLEFIYTGVCQVDSGELKSFLRTGKELGVQSLLENIDGDDVSKTQPLVEKVEKESDISSDPELGFFENPKRILNNLDQKPLEDPESTKILGEEENEKEEIFLGEPSVEEPFKETQSKFTEVEGDVDDPVNEKLIKKVGESTQHLCVHCSKIFPSKKQLMQHKTNKHGTEIRCELCSYIGNKTYLERHIKNKHNNSRYECDECPHQTNTTSALVRHKQVKHQGLRFQCKLCVRYFTNKNSLKKHMQKRHTGPVFKCDYCDHETKTELLLQRHLNKMKEFKEVSHLLPYV